MLYPVTKKSNPAFRGMASQAQIDDNPNLIAIDLQAIAVAMKARDVPVISDDPKVVTDLDPSKIKRKP